MQRFFGFLLLIFLTLAPSVGATDMFVTDLEKITVRAGKGIEYKVIGTLQSGTKVEIIQPDEEWSLIRTEEGTSGWVVSRYLTDEKPATLMLRQLKNSAGSLYERMEELEAENQKLKKENQELRSKIMGIEDVLSKARSEYENLRKDSRGFLDLKSEFENLSKKSERQAATIASLENQAKNALLISALKWVIAGAGIIVIGVMIGANMKRRRPSLL